MWISCAFLAIAIFAKAEGGTQNNDHGNTYPSHGGNTYPATGGNTYPLPGGNTYPHPGNNINPAHGGNTYPHGRGFTELFKYPYGCSHYCEYQASSKYNQYDDSVDFKVKAKVAYGYWAGLGFSDVDRFMPKSDCYTGHLSNEHHSQKFTFQDRYLFGRNRDSVPIDRHQDGKVKSHSYYDGYLTFTFNRKRYTGDHSDVSLKNCVYVLHAWGGQALGSHAISKHTRTAVSADKLCFGPTQPYPPAPTYPPTYYPPTYPTYPPTYPPTYYPPTYYPPTYPTYPPTYYPPTYPTHRPTYHPPYPPVPTYNPFPIPFPLPNPGLCFFKKCKPYERCQTLLGFAFCRKCKDNDYRRHLGGGGGGGKCGGGGGGYDPCDKHDCPYHSTCETRFGRPYCKCKTNYRKVNGKCHHNDPCDDHHCPYHSTCEVRHYLPYCECDKNYRKVNGKCQGDSHDRCHDYKGCGPHGTCYVTRFKVRCKCYSGYHQVPYGKGICKRKRNPGRPILFAAGR